MSCLAVPYKYLLHGKGLRLVNPIDHMLHCSHLEERARCLKLQALHICPLLFKKLLRALPSPTVPTPAEQTPAVPTCALPTENNNWRRNFDVFSWIDKTSEYPKRILFLQLLTLCAQQELKNFEHLFYLLTNNPSHTLQPTHARTHANRHTHARKPTHAPTHMQPHFLACMLEPTCGCL